MTAEPRIASITKVKGQAHAGLAVAVMATLLMLALATSAQGSGQAKAPEWSIDAFVEAAVNTWKNSLDAQSQLDLATISEGLSIPVRSASLTVSGGVSTAGSSGADPSADRSDAKKISAKVPITERVGITGSYDMDRSTGSIKLSYTLPRTWLAVGSSGVSGLARKLLGSAGPSEEGESALAMARLKLVAAEGSMRLNARKAYINALKSVKASAIAQEEHRLAQVALEIAKRRRDAGIAADSEVAQAGLTVLDCEIALAKAVNDEKWMKLELAKMSGEDMTQAQFGDLPEFGAEIPSLEDLVHAATNYDVELAQAQASLDSALRDLESVKSLLPTVAIEAQLSSGDSAPKLTASANWSIALSRSLDVRKAEITAEQRRQSVGNKREALAETIEKSLEQLNMDTWSAARWQAQLEESQRSYDTALQSYKQGDLLLVDLERAQLNLKRSRDNYVANWGGVWQTWYTLMNMCGM
ncbi:MAG: TolC family protein [Clostridia bacterium]|nr:TolC family protein [Clostridia bacterium]